MNAKYLKLLKIAAVLICVFLVSMLVTTYLRMADVEEELELGKIKNNNTTFVEYGDEKFYFSSEVVDGKPSFKFINRNDENHTEKVIEDYANMYVDSKILAKDNMLFYYTGVNTYVYDIASGKKTLFAEGQMQYLTDEWYVTLFEGTLYKGVYYHNTMNTKNINPLTSDGTIVYAYEDDSNLYYTARTSKNYYALMGINKTDLAVTVYDTIQGYNETYLEVFSNKDYIFALVEYLDGSAEYALRIIPKEDKKNRWDVKLDKQVNPEHKDYYSYVFLKESDLADPKLINENIFMLRFKTNESGEKLQDGYMKFDLKTEEIKLEKPELNALCLHEYSAEIKGAQLIVYKENKELFKVKLTGQKEGEVNVTNIYQIDNETYYKITTDPSRKVSTYVKVNADNIADVY